MRINMFDLMKINILLNDCYTGGRHSMDMREKQWAKIMLKEGKSKSDICMFFLLVNNFFELSNAEHCRLLDWVQKDPPLLSTFGIETLLRVADNPSIFMEVYKFKCEHECYSSYNGPYKGFRDDNDKKTWDAKIRTVLKKLDKLKKIYESNIFP